MAIEDTLEASVTKALELERHILDLARTTIPQAIEAIRRDESLPPFTKVALIELVEKGQGQLEADIEVRSRLESFRRILYNYKVLKHVAPAYCEIDFVPSQVMLSEGSLGPQQDDWESGATAVYRQITEALPTKLQNQIDAVKAICRSLRSLATSINSLMVGYALGVLGLILAALGLILAFAGLIAAIPTGGAGLAVAVLGFVVAIGSFALAILSMRLLGTAQDLISEAVQQLSDTEVSVGAAKWPTIKSIEAGAVGWAA